MVEVLFFAKPGLRLCDPLHEELLVPHLAHLLLRLLRGAGNAFGLREAVAEPRRGHRLHHHGELLRGGLLLQQGETAEGQDGQECGECGGDPSDPKACYCLQGF